MHNCKLTRAVLIDHALGETPTDQASEVLAAVDLCPSCRAEYASLRNTLRVSGQALQSAAPAKEFWPGYHARLKDKLVQQEGGAKEQAAVFSPVNLPLGSRLLNGLRWFAGASVRLPAPVAIAILLIVAFLSYNMHSVSTAPESARPSNTVTQSESPIIEVPVVQERVVTRTVYVERKARRSSVSLPVRVDLTAADQRRRSEVSNKTAMSLAGFKPTDQVQLTVIKGSYQDEK